MSARAGAAAGAALLVLAGLAGAVSPSHASSTPPTKEPLHSGRTERYRDPDLAALRSLVFPGWGQHYNGEPGKGFLFTGGVAVGTLFATQLVQISSSEHGKQFEQGVGIALMASLWGWSVGDAYVSAPRINRENGYDMDALLPPDRTVRVTLVALPLPF